MIHVMPDPHPGRCQNLRQVVRVISSQIEYLRCLDYEGTEHVCRFPEPRPAPPASVSSFKTSTPPQPKPWIRPENSNG